VVGDDPGDHMDRARIVDVTPSASRLTESLRDIGYDFAAALADLVDNSVTAGATRVDIEVVFEGAGSYVVIADDGAGMSEGDLHEALRFGTRREYSLGDLGRYGLGLKTASISQCREVSVFTRRAPVQRRLSAKTLDLDHIARSDRWEVVDPPAVSPLHRALEWLGDGPGTVIFWRRLDRVLPERRPDGGWARRRLEQSADRAGLYLGMVFHRFIEGSARGGKRLTITMNGEKVRPWNPFAPFEEHRTELPPLSFEVAVDRTAGKVHLHRYVLPPKRLFSSATEFEHLSGPRKWNRQQGLYIYRADRLIQYGGWSGLRAADEHTKFARAALDFQTQLDDLFQINVAKMRVALPAEVRSLVEQPIHELCRKADAVYRREQTKRTRRASDRDGLSPRTVPAGDIGASVIAAALDVGEHAALARIMDSLRSTAPDVADSLGW
jgi:hypothetical protein